MRLIDNWRQAHKFASVRFAASGMLLSALGTALVAAATVAGSIWAYVPTLCALGLAFVTGLCVILGRIIDQPSLSAPKPTVPPDR